MRRWAKRVRKSRRPPRVIFYAPTRSEADFDTRDFYQQDIAHLSELGFEVITVRTTFGRGLFRKADFIFAWWFPKLAIPGMLCRLRRIPLVAFGNAHANSGAAGDLSSSRLRSLSTRLGLSLATVVAVPSHAEAESMAHSDLFLGHVAVMPHCVRVGGHASAAFHADSVDMPEAPFALMIFAATAGNIERKRVADSLDAFVRFSIDHPELRLVIGGQPGEGTAALNSLVEASGLSDRIDLLGRVSEAEKWGLLSRASFFLSLSRWEGYGLAIAEAAASELPVVADRVPAVMEHLGEAGFYPASSDIVDITAAMSEAYHRANMVQPGQISSDSSCEVKVAQLRKLLVDAGISLPEREDHG